MSSIREHQARCTYSRGVRFVGAGENVNAPRASTVFLHATGIVREHEARCTFSRRVDFVGTVEDLHARESDIRGHQE